MGVIYLFTDLIPTSCGVVLMNVTAKLPKIFLLVGVAFTSIPMVVGVHYGYFFLFRRDPRVGV